MRYARFVCLFLWLAAQVAFGAEIEGRAALALQLERLPVTATVLHTGAHPDDEDTALLAYLARGRGIRTAYLSATRGEGGQNLLGTEEYEALGLLRTQELLDARRLDGALQFFTRAYDFGFSKDAQEALAKWGHERTLSDFVRIIRRFQPDVIISRFSGTPRDGHGQHQAAGIFSREAYTAAADPTKFPEQIKEGLQPWQVKKFYLEINRFGPQANAPLPEGALIMDVGDYNEILGRSYLELAMEGRSLHRSQAMGVPQIKGSFRQAVMLTETSLPGGVKAQIAKEHDILDDVGGLPVGALTAEIARARAAFASDDSASMITALARGLELARKLPEPLRTRKVREFSEAIAMAHGLAAEALADHAEVAPGDKFSVTVTVWNRVRTQLKVVGIEMDVPHRSLGVLDETPSSDWKPATLEYNQSNARTFSVTVPLDEPPSQPYWLRQPRHGDSYEVADPSLIGLPENPPLLEARVRLATSGTELELSIPVEYRYVDHIYGQKDRAIDVVPDLAASTSPPLAVFPPHAQREVTVAVRSNSGLATNHKVETRGDSHAPLHIPKPGEETTATVDVHAPAHPAAFDVLDNGKTATGYQVISYPHIRPQYWFKPAETKLVPIDVKVPPKLRVGYIMGAGDDMPEYLRQLGITVDLLTTADLASGNLNQYDAIAAGIRAYAVRKDLADANARLLDYVKNGGVFIVQYNSDWLGRSGGDFPFGPYPMRQTAPGQFGAARVAMEEQPVRILKPDDPLFNFPNKITEADFNGWVQERGLYFMREWDAHYTPLLESHDPNEPPQEGGMLAARYGKGLYIYTGYAWFRQLPAGVPGAYRIWANLLAAGKEHTK